MGLLFQRGHSEDEKMCKETKNEYFYYKFWTFFFFFSFFFCSVLKKKKKKRSQYKSDLLRGESNPLKKSVKTPLKSIKNPLKSSQEQYIFPLE